MPNVCVVCVKDAHLKKLVEEDGSELLCSLCGEVRTGIDAESKRFISLAKALVRYHYSEWDYNPHWGGIGYEALFYGSDNIFFDSQWEEISDGYEEVALCIAESEAYEDYDKGISVFAGYDSEGAQCMLLEAVKTDLDSKVVSIAQRLETENHFRMEAEMLDILRKYMGSAREVISSDQALFRGRNGVASIQRAESCGFETEYIYEPFSGAAIGAPPPNLASGGRANRAGVSFFYCATDRETAVSEIRPHPGEQISIGRFYPSKDVCVFDLSDTKLLEYFETDERLDEFKPLNTLGVYLNRVVTPSDRKHYSTTQLIADCVRQLGFDGILFNSTVGSGKNLVFFDTEYIVQDPAGSSVVAVKSLEYQIEDEKMVEQ